MIPSAVFWLEAPRQCQIAKMACDKLVTYILIVRNRQVDDYVSSLVLYVSISK